VANPPSPFPPDTAAAGAICGSVVVVIGVVPSLLGINYKVYLEEEERK